ncbi:carbohydrate ABC transporter permease [Schumannella luteola]|uniref:Multiple sugar transport system permease protein/raffinose/stachyose/melibiose transport system permease protein n=1 Tax=Schumannella luteola TaxID=472059 RepID=A0A852YKZ5_9MICO|nr:multiple sugar transport system permease protein/raffinose/stachyose/melibiose transport system permease protein [Schumannella luteola]
MNAPRPGRLAQRRSRQSGVKLALLLLVAVGLAPYLFMIVTSFKSNEQFTQNYWAPTWPLHLENFGRAWDQVAPYLGNSLFIAIVSSALIAVIASIAAFVLSRYRFRGRGIVYGSILVLMAVPGIASLIPMFILMRDLGLLNTYAVLVIPYVASGLVLGTVIMRNTIESIPQTIYDAARVDGAGPVRLYRSITLPLALPAVGTVSLLTLSGVWNDFFWPLLVVTDDRLRTVSVGLQFFQGQNAIDYGPLMAGYVIASLPLVALFVPLSKYFLAGVQGGIAGAH